jgi:transposase InsO family protein
MKAYPVTLLCAVMRVSRSGFYQYLRYGWGYVIDPDFLLITRVRRIHSNTRASYGSRRMSRQLREDGYDVGRCRARSLMKKAGVVVKYPKKFKRTTDSKHKLPVAPNLLDRKFSIDRPNAVWCADITYLWTVQGWLYLAVIIDLYSRKVVGWAIDSRMKTALVKKAFSMAYFRRKPHKGLVHHSDRGSQYASQEYQQMLGSYGMKCSMSRKGDCWDNAVAESFFHSLKTEWIKDTVYFTRDRARADVMEYIEMFYNSHRLHSFIDYKNPNDFEKQIERSEAA